MTSCSLIHRLQEELRRITLRMKSSEKDEAELKARASEQKKHLSKLDKDLSKVREQLVDLEREVEGHYRAHATEASKMTGSADLAGERSRALLSLSLGSLACPFPIFLISIDRSLTFQFKTLLCSRVPVHQGRGSLKDFKDRLRERCPCCPARG